MQAKKYRHIESGEKYNALFPMANGKTSTIKKSALVSDTVNFIPKVVGETLYQTEKIAKLLKGNSTEETCRNIWDFVYKHIRYEKDEDGVEQIRAPSRTWHDRQRGVDCDCYTTFISSILTNLKIPHLLRIAKYFKDYFQHIYPVAFDENGEKIIIDCVVDKFNYEEPYSEIKDTTMDLQYLSGIEDTSSNMGELGKVKFIDTLKKGLNVANKFNPATALLRNGFLLAMRLNMFNVPQRLKWAYLSEADAAKRGMDIPKWKKLVGIKDNLENMHFVAGGKKEDLKKAILTGKGNKNHEVSGLGYLPDNEVFLMDLKTPFPQLIGAEIYQSEKESLEGFGELGEPFTAASLAAATAAIAALAGLLKSVGNLFPKHDKASEDFNTNTEADAAAAKAVQNTPTVSLPTSSLPQTAASATFPATSTTQSLPAMSSGAAVLQNDNGRAMVQSSSALPAPPPDNIVNTNGDTQNNNTGFWEQNKKWLKPTIIGISTLGVATILYKIFAPKPAQITPAIAGIDKKKTPPKGKHGEDGKIKPINLM